MSNAHVREACRNRFDSTPRRIDMETDAHACARSLDVKGVGGYEKSVVSQAC